ncbi:hypothetical protein HPB50_015290 [Hyalomma asiaticum]|uniref:Uncharacterized protein n=1 Tax=Hyalomma asiaticum TaxID=266040 RepID=A0ACB7RU33_HYAAI|nr:hypothetical protein HPB50_015290 [Hyalomma asiaticum]
MDRDNRRWGFDCGQKLFISDVFMKAIQVSRGTRFVRRYSRCERNSQEFGYPRLDSGRLRKYGSFVQEIPLIGDWGYPLEPWLLTPVPGNPAPGTPEDEYNKEHASTRNVVERCIGVLKSRFRCLQRYRALLYKPDRAAGIVSACAALHNIALEAGEPVLAEDTNGGTMPPAPVRGSARLPEDGQLRRNRELFLRGREQRRAVVSLFRPAEDWRVP